GVLSIVFAHDRHASAREITNSALFLSSPSSTFHGRDIFSPVAAAIACGLAHDEVGPPLRGIELASGSEPEQLEANSWRGTVLNVDHFGNVITNFKTSQFACIDSGPFEIRARDHRVTEFRRTFGGAPAGLCFAYFGSSDYIELGMNQASAAAFLGLSPGDSITVET
ncbi:MAG: SAM-dependent chlorinase/fluorinase, partial [Acidobacteriaceae bacterium]|nr:SAM-dependent chlorinase/fluorinase [Acidobacteriaceae bacterium]